MVEAKATCAWSNAWVIIVCTTAFTCGVFLDILIKTLFPALIAPIKGIKVKLIG